MQAAHRSITVQYIVRVVDAYIDQSLILCYYILVKTPDCSQPAALPVTAQDGTSIYTVYTEGLLDQADRSAFGNRFGEAAESVINFDGFGRLILLSFVDNPQGVSGFSLTTGTKYQATGITRDNFSGRFGFEETFVNNFRIIGQGPGNNFLVHENFHITVNANGTVTSFHDNFSIECK